MAFAIIALNKRNVTYLDHFSSFLVNQGRDITGRDGA